MSVLKGEGKVPILFNSTSIAAGSLTHGGYLARPDLAGEWPTIIMLASVWGVTSSTKDICRRLARQGFAVIAPDLYPAGSRPSRSVPVEDAADAASAISASRAAAVLEDIVEFVQNPTGYWSNAEDGYGVLAIGSGATHAVPAAGRTDVLGLALVSPPLATPQVDEGEDPALDPVEPLRSVAAPVLVLGGRGDVRAPVEDVQRARAAVPHAEWILYEGVGADFIDDYAEGFDLGAFTDAMERLSVFFEKALPATR